MAKEEAVAAAVDKADEARRAKPKAASATTPQQEETKTNVDVEQATPKRAGSPSREERMEERRAMYAKEAGGSKTPRTKAQIKADAEQNAARGLKTPRTITQEAQTDQAPEATPEPALEPEVNDGCMTARTYARKYVPCVVRGFVDLDCLNDLLSGEIVE